MPRSLRTTPLAIAAMGITVDGREISETDIDDIVATYNYKKYGARINLDHSGDWSGWVANNLHGVDLNGGMLGDVLEVTSGKNEDGVKVLYAVLAPNASFVQLNQADQAVYFSIEINRDFMKSGQAYLTGLAVTDYPASTYTDRIHFSNKDKVSGDDDTDSLLKIDLGLDDSEKPKKSLFKQLFNFGKDENEMKREEFAAAMTDSLGEPLSKFTQALDENTTAIKALLSKQDGEQEENLGIEQGSSDEKPTALEDELSSVKKELNELSAAFKKAAGSQADDTTLSEEEHLGDDGKYNNLL